MSIAEIVSELKAERTRIDRAISALEGLSENGSARLTDAAAKKDIRRKGHLSAEGRKRISEMMKKRWAERRKKMAASKK